MDAKLEYLVRELWILAWNASVQRADVYGGGVKSGSEEVRPFRENLISYLCSEVIPKYRDHAVNDLEHYQNLDEFVAYANSVGRQVLGQFGYKYGVAQKLLNLALKYYWCLGLVTEPPHCPVDRIVIDKTTYRGANWTEIRQRSEYQAIIEDIKRRAVPQSAALWELCNFRRR